MTPGMASTTAGLSTSAARTIRRIYIPLVYDALADHVVVVVQ